MDLSLFLSFSSGLHQLFFVCSTFHMRLPKSFSSFRHNLLQTAASLKSNESLSVCLPVFFFCCCHLQISPVNYWDHLSLNCDILLASSRSTHPLLFFLILFTFLSPLLMDRHTYHECQSYVFAANKFVTISLLMDNMSHTSFFQRPWYTSITLLLPPKNNLSSFFCGSWYF